MRLLWLTRDYPYPFDTGQTLYTHGLVTSVAAAGAAVTAVAYNARRGDQDQPKRRFAQDGVDWLVVPRRKRSAALSLLTALPKDAFASTSAEYWREVEGLLRTESWDAVVIDYVAMGWTLPALCRWRDSAARKPRLVYVSHNHERTLRPAVANNFKANPAMKLLLHVDAAKYARLERELVRRVDVITAITDRDGALFHEEAGNKPVVVLTPGYTGKPHADWTLDERTPRKAVISGSFEWIIKQQNLIEFVRVADPIFARADIRLQVVGFARPDFIAQIKSWTSACDFTGPVAEVAPYLEQARFGIMAERIGGGFKLKMLDYVFAGLPLAAIEDQVAGLPLIAGTDMIAADTVERLCARVIAAIDDIGLLDRMRKSALARCSGRFDWSDRGRDLLHVIAHSAADGGRRRECSTQGI